MCSKLDFIFISVIYLFVFQRSNPLIRINYHFLYSVGWSNKLLLTE
jgi:hypothetical protein